MQGQVDNCHKISLEWMFFILLRINFNMYLFMFSFWEYLF